MDAFAVTRLAAGTAFLVVAAASDLGTRRVRNPLWIGLGTLGLVILGTELLVESAPWPTWSLAGSAALLFYAVFFGRPLFDEDGFHARPGRMGLFFAAAAMWIAPLGFAGIVASSVPIVELASMPVMLVVYQLMLRARLLAGGADAKCLMALTLLVPTYPHASPFPVFAADPRVQPAFQALFPFSFVVHHKDGRLACLGRRPKPSSKEGRLRAGSRTALPQGTWAGLTSGFGMGPGVSPPLWPSNHC